MMSGGLFFFSCPDMKPGLLRTLAIVGAFTVGAIAPQASSLAWVIRWLIMAMLFITFLQIRFSRKSLTASHACLLIANFIMGFVGLAVGWLFGNREIMLAAFFAGIAPTATAAPVIVGFLRGKVEYVVIAFLLTNVAVAALLPVLLPLVLGVATAGIYLQVAQSVGLVVFAPMLAAWVLRKLHHQAMHWPGKLRNVSFGMWVLALFLITANASAFFRREGAAEPLILVKLGLVSMVVCALNFLLGAWIGGKEFRREASQSLGQKNTTFTIYLAMVYANPLVALGPTFYVLWHNLWNSFQLYRAERKG
jgi:BASS family bile acid:Na+ symporter